MNRTASEWLEIAERLFNQRDYTAAQAAATIARAKAVIDQPKVEHVGGGVVPTGGYGPKMVRRAKRDGD